MIREITSRAPPGSGTPEDEAVIVTGALEPGVHANSTGRLGKNPLPSPPSDVPGMGLERLTAVVQTQDSNYHTAS